MISNLRIDHSADRDGQSTASGYCSVTVAAGQQYMAIVTVNQAWIVLSMVFKEKKKLCPV